MNKNEIPLSLKDLAYIFAAELKLSPSDNLYRYLHPVMVCGVENGQLLLRGTRTSGTLVIDKYRSQQNPEYRRPSSLEPGLNLTKEFSPNYRSEDKRLAISLKIKDQPEGLRIYNDFGSEKKSIYLTLPEDQFFHVSLEVGDITEIGIGVHIHSLMSELHIKEEPQFLSYIESHNGVGVAVYIQKPEQKEQRVEILFSKVGNTYNIDIPQEVDDRKLLELLGVYRLLLEDKTFNEAIGQGGVVYKKDDLISQIANTPGLDTLVKPS